ncbi:MAG: maleylpyruvate isomerase N-terminal domain-containing protein [Mycobacterium sp.]|nr:maleylpyruvate isomerase N-terminal domain-containing protein [Mycobacterium sp.]
MKDQAYEKTVATYLSAVKSFVQLVSEIPSDRWDRLALGVWDLRSLVGHSSRSLTTVITYMDTTAEREEIVSPQQYYARVKTIASVDPSGVVDRGRQAGTDLGADPPAAVAELAERVANKLASSGDRLIKVIGGLGMWLHTYLPTRTFELAVHGLDIAAAADLPSMLGDDVLDESTALAAQIAVEIGTGETALMALTGRRPLPPSFSVV